MQHFVDQIDFSDVEPLDQLIYDPELAYDPTNVEQLKRLTRTHYAPSYQQYQNMINLAIKANNLPGLEVLWQAMYHYDNDSPDYEHNVYVAAEFGQLKTFQHVLYAYLNYHYQDDDPDDLDPLSFSKLKSLATLNPDEAILHYINLLQQDVNQDQLVRMCLTDITRIPVAKFYTHLKWVNSQV